MINQSATFTPGQLNRNMSDLYQRFLVGDIEPLECSDLLDQLIGLYAVADDRNKALC
jgi:hypothetical protein